MSGADLRRCLGGQGEFEFVQQQVQFRLGLGVAREAQFSPVGRGHVDVDHLHGGELLEHGTGREAGRERFELLAEGDVQAVGEERDKDVRFDAVLCLVEDGADGEITFECFEGCFDLDQLQVELPELLSSTVRDLTDYRLAVQDACVHRAEAACLLSEEDWVSGYDDTVEKCRTRVRDANGFMLLAGYWYGSVPPGKDRSITHIEFDEALRKWGQQKFPPMAVLMPEPGSTAADELRNAAQNILENPESIIDAAAHAKVLAAFHSALTGSWRTVTPFKDKPDLRERAIASCWMWKGRTPLAAARGEVTVVDKQSTFSQVTEEQLGQLGRSTHLSAVKAVLSRVADHADVPALGILVHGDDDAGQRAFLQAVNPTSTVGLVLECLDGVW